MAAKSKRAGLVMQKGKSAREYLSNILATSPSSSSKDEKGEKEGYFSRKVGSLTSSRRSSSSNTSASSISTSYILGDRSSRSSSVGARSDVGSFESATTSAYSIGQASSSLVPLRASLAPPHDSFHIKPQRHYDSDPTWMPYPADPYSLRHSEFGWCENAEYRYTSQWRGPDEDDLKPLEEEPSLIVYLTTYISYLILICIGHMRDFIGKRTHKAHYKSLTEQNGYAPLNSDFDSFYTRRLKTRIEDLFSRPVTGVAGRTITCLDRVTKDYGHTFEFLGSTTQALNISSYNYLGFAQSRGGCADSVEQIIRSHGIGSGGPRAEGGTLDLHGQLERLVARFLGTEDAMVVSMGFATNSTTLPALMSKGCLIISDELNHSSIRFGARLSNAMVRQFKHNDMEDLENLLRECISQGQPRTHRPWKKILLVVEGLYSMEGTLVHLPGIMALRRKYKFNIFMDEAHSIGALGPRGRGVCDYFNVDPRSIDILMGTFTKSFGGAGGYVAGKRSQIQALRKLNHAQIYAESMPPPVIQQIITAMATIMGPEALDVVPSLASLPSRLLDGSEGIDRLRRLAFNARYLSSGLRRLGFVVYGHKDSPIVPVLIFNPGKLSLFSRLMLERHNIVIVVVAYPATPLVSGRARFCVSAAHTKEDLDRTLRAVDEVGGCLDLKLAPRKHESIDQVLADNAERVLAL